MAARAGSRSARLSRPTWRPSSAQPATRRRWRRPCSARSRGPRSTRARRASTPATAASTASRASTSRATTPSRANSASRPDERSPDAMFTSTHLHDPRRDRAILGATLVALVAIAWVALAAWSASPYARYLHHDAVSATFQVGEAGLFVVGWIVM